MFLIRASWQFLARRIVSNVRVLEGALNRLAAAHSYLKSPIDLNIARTELADILRDADRTDRHPSDHSVRGGLLQHQGIRVGGNSAGPATLSDQGRLRSTSRKSLTTKSLPDIGREFNRDHTTVLHSVNRIEELRATDSAMAEDIEIITRRLES